MRKLKTNEFIVNLENSNTNNLFITPSVDSKRLFMKELDYNKIKTDIISFGEIYIKYARENFLNLADEAIKKYYFNISISEKNTNISKDVLYNVIQEKTSLNLKMNSFEESIYLNYRELLIENGFIEKTDVIDMILKTNYLNTFSKYDKIFFMMPRYTSLKENQMISEILSLENVIIMDYSYNLISEKKHKHFIADGLEFLIYEIANQIISEYKKDKNIKIAITTESKKTQNDIIRFFADYNIYTNMPIISEFYNLNAVRESFENDIDSDNIEEYFEDLKSKFSENIISNFNLESSFKRIIENIQKYNIEFPKLYIENVFKNIRFTNRYNSNIHVLNPAEIILDYDYIYQIGISDNDFMPSDRFDNEQIIGSINNIINHCKEFIVSTYDLNTITKAEFLMLDLEKNYVNNFEWIKSGNQITNLQKKYFDDVDVNLDRKDNNTNEFNNTVKLPLRTILSASKIENYKKCAFKYYCDYIADFDIEEDGMYPELGSFSHKVLENYFKNNTTKVYDEEEFNRIFGWTKLSYKNLNSFQFSLLESKLKNVIKSECRSGSDVVFTEKKFEHRFFKDENGKDIIFKGVIDRVDKSEEGYILIDYKLSSSSIPSKTKLENGDALQLPIYIANYFENIDSVHYLDINDASRKSSVVFGNDFNKEEFMKICADNIKTIVSQMDMGLISRTADKINCRYCKYNDFCKRFWND